eukprot:8220553-Alexandrium_andersonii.AAC.1
MCIRDSSRAAPVVVRFGISVDNRAEPTPSELRGPISRPFLGPGGSSSERLRQLGIFGKAGCGRLRQDCSVDGP